MTIIVICVRWDHHDDDNHHHHPCTIWSWWRSSSSCVWCDHDDDYHHLRTMRSSSPAYDAIIIVYVQCEHHVLCMNDACMNWCICAQCIFVRYICVRWRRRTRKWKGVWTWTMDWTWRYCHLASAPEENGRRSLALAGTKGSQLLVGSEAMRLIEDDANLLLQHGLLIGPFCVA